MLQQQFLGKYCGKVVDPVDPMMLGRIVALVPAVSELPLTWAMPTVTVGAPWVVAGCPFPPPPVANGPCIEAEWLPPTASLRVTSDGLPLLVQSSQAICTPTGTPVVVGVTQTRVMAE